VKNDQTTTSTSIIIMIKLNNNGPNLNRFAFQFNFSLQVDLGTEFRLKGRADGTLNRHSYWYCYTDSAFSQPL